MIDATAPSEMPLWFKFTPAYAGCLMFAYWTNVGMQTMLSFNPAAAAKIARPRTTT